MSATRPPLSERDWAQLSAYLDGALGARERAALERRLAAEPHLRQALDELRETVALLRALPTLRAPRDFTLDPALYGRTRRRWWNAAAALQLSGALGTALAVVLIVLGMFAPARRTAQVSAPAASVALQATAVLADKSTPTVAATPSPTPTVTATPTVAATSAPPAADTLDAETFGEAADADGAANTAEGAPPQALFAAPVGGAAEEAEAAPPPAPVMREPVEQATPTVAPSPTPSATASATPSATPSVTPTEERRKPATPTPAPAETRPRWWLVLAGSVTLLASIGLLWLGKRRA